MFYSFYSSAIGLAVLREAYSGRDNPPHSQIWINYFLRMVELYSKKVYELSKESSEDDARGSLSYLNAKEKEFLKFLVTNRIYEIVPIEISKKLGVTNKTIINRCARLAEKQTNMRYNSVVKLNKGCFGAKNRLVDAFSNFKFKL